MERLLTLGSRVLFILSFIMTANLAYTYVFDIEPMSAQKHYDMELRDYERVHGLESLPDHLQSLENWVRHDDERFDRFCDWIGDECACAFDWTYESKFERDPGDFDR